MYLKTYGAYPPFNYSKKDLLEHFGMVSLEQRRFLLSCCFVRKLLSNQIDCSQILLNLNFTVPSMFYLPKASTNILLASPSYRMLKCFNEVSHLFVFNMSEHIYTG
ncbi:unnamed protein product [Acanthoscelides obtectus]|uniref:Uncharacterized protein n=1 Tax=Acanthoscelides obtectus TaxID=200917 RepID=A0A9P0K7F6_ACAOB|nr:unnamed protein product [Acanthoscelides obtectus]CAK1622809.1 hypothetical protein AOBTE_LOCUS1677 [Acanthoscelides obtectus]